MVDEASRKMAEAVVARGNAVTFIPGKTGETSELSPIPTIKSHASSNLPG